MNRYFWSIPGLTIYLYAMSVWTQYGFYSYFGVPYNLIDASFVTNVVYYFQLLQVGGVLLRALWIFVAVVALLIVLLLYALGRHWKSLITVSTVMLLVVLWYSSSFGTWLAKNTSYFYIVPQGCVANIGTTTTSVVVGFDGTDAIFVPVSTSTHELLGGFAVRDLTQLPCDLAMTETGILRN